MGNSAMDIACATESLTNLITVCEQLGIEEENVARWKKMLGDCGTRSQTSPRPQASWSAKTNSSSSVPIEAPGTELRW